MCELLRFTVRLPPVGVRLDYPDLSAEGARSEHETSVRREITFSTNTGPERPTPAHSRASTIPMPHGYRPLGIVVKRGCHGGSVVVMTGGVVTTSYNTTSAMDFDVDVRFPRLHSRLTDLRLSGEFATKWEIYFRRKSRLGLRLTESTEVITPPCLLKPAFSTAFRLVDELLTGSRGSDTGSLT